MCRSRYGSRGAGVQREERESDEEPGDHAASETHVCTRGSRVFMCPLYRGRAACSLKLGAA